MSEQTSQEPTMEEILASIRRIISEDEPGAEAAAEAEAEAPAPEPEPEPAPVKAEEAPEPAPAPEPPTEPDDEPLELTQKVETLGDLDVVENVAEPEPAYAPPPAAPESTLVSAPAAAVAGAAFDKLSAVIAMPAEGRTLEDVVRELLRPLLQQWLDDNLPKIVQEAVDAEVARIARGRVR